MRRFAAVLTCALTLVPGVAVAGNVTNDPFVSYIDPAGVGTSLVLKASATASRGSRSSGSCPPAASATSARAA